MFGVRTEINITCHKNLDLSRPIVSLITFLKTSKKHFQVRQGAAATPQIQPWPLRVRGQEGVQPAEAAGGVHDLPDDAKGAEVGGKAQEEVPHRRGLPMQKVWQGRAPTVEFNRYEMEFETYYDEIKAGYDSISNLIYYTFKLLPKKMCLP